MKKHLNISFILICSISILQSCALLGTKVLYEGDLSIKDYKRIGIIKPNFVDNEKQVIPNIDDLIYRSIEDNFKACDVIAFPIDSSIIINYDTVNYLIVDQIFDSYDIDALLVLKFDFLNSLWQMMFDPKSYDGEVKIKLISKENNIIIETFHTSLNGNTYWTVPTNERIAHDVVKCGLKPIIKNYKR